MPPVLHGQAEAGGHRRARRAFRTPLRPAQGPLVIDTEGRRPLLLQAKLAALVDRRWGRAEAERGEYPAGAFLRRGGQAWVYSEEPARLLGGALIWATCQTRPPEDLHLLAEAQAGALARRALLFARPPAVWSVSGQDLVPAAPEPLPREAAPVAAPELAALISGAGADVVAEHGLLLAEVRGLEVGRVEAHPEGPRLVVGVGRHDREAWLAGHGASGPAATAAELDRVVADIRRRRVHGGPSHPAYTLAPERWLRSVVVSDPSLVGARSLAPISPAAPRENLLGRSPAPAVGVDGDGLPVVVVCSTGIDPELVPLAAEVRQRVAELSGGRWRLVLVVPDGDDHPVTRRLAEALAEPAQVRTVPPTWRAHSA